ncbi:MAG: hypothetical protein KDJ54_19505 [Candidatus Competibacteraceae bacterium]|nr:hypothetical protein [Candidatus Competibacteraceae bacterium]
MARIINSFTRSHPVQNARQRAWNGMRIFKRFSTVDLESSAEISTANLQKYVGALRRAGYVRLERPKRNGRALGHAIYRLVQCSGPRAPIVRNDGSGIYDPNHDRFVPFPHAESEDAKDDPAPVASVTIQEVDAHARSRR